MDVPRSDAMILVAYFLARWVEPPAPGNPHSRPPREIGVETWKETFASCHSSLNDGRGLATFVGSLHGQVRGFQDAIRSGTRFSDSRQRIAGPWISRPRGELWLAVRQYFTGGGASSTGFVRLTGGDAAIEDVATDATEGNYVPEGGDRREVAERQIRVRRGQQQFRDALRNRYGDRCVVTGCRVVAVLEAAHINPYRGEGDHHPENGLLLRADAHTLFDLDLLGVEPDTLRVELHPGLAGEYRDLIDTRLQCSAGARPSREALAGRYKLFCRRREQPL